MSERYVYWKGQSHWRTACDRFYLVRGEGELEGEWRIRSVDPATVGELTASGILAAETYFPTRAAAVRTLSELCRSLDIDPPGALRRRASRWQTVDGSIDLFHAPHGPSAWSALVRIDSVSSFDSRAGFRTREAATAWARERQAAGASDGFSTRMGAARSLRTQKAELRRSVQPSTA